MDLEAMHRTAVEIAQSARALPGVSDVLVPQDVDYPALRLDISRLRASELGLNEKEVVDNVITALTSDMMIAPSYWVDPKSGNDYFLTVQYPENYVGRLEDLTAIPLHGVNHAENDPVGHRQPNQPHGIADGRGSLSIATGGGCLCIAFGGGFGRRA